MLRLMEKKIFDEPVKNNKITYENIRKIATGQEDDHNRLFIRLCLL